MSTPKAEAREWWLTEDLQELFGVTQQSEEKVSCEVIEKFDVLCDGDTLRTLFACEDDEVVAVSDNAQQTIKSEKKKREKRERKKDISSASTQVNAWFDFVRQHPTVVAKYVVAVGTKMALDMFTDAVIISTGIDHSEIAMQRLKEKAEGRVRLVTRVVSVTYKGVTKLAQILTADGDQEEAD